MSPKTTYYREQTELTFDRLSSLDDEISNNTYSEVLSVLGDAVKAAVDRADSARNSQNPDIAEIVPEMEGEIIGNLLGAAYLVCQPKITAVVQAALAARSQVMGEKPNSCFSAFGCKPEDVRRCGESFGRGYSKVEVLWHLGNYFKHSGEWRLDGPMELDGDIEKNPNAKHTIPVIEHIELDWDMKNSNAKHTIPVIKAAGLSPATSGNLLTGAEVLGNDEYSNMTAFTKIIDGWSEDVREHIWAFKCT